MYWQPVLRNCIFSLQSCKKLEQSFPKFCSHFAKSKNFVFISKVDVSRQKSENNLFESDADVVSIVQT